MQSEEIRRRFLEFFKNRGHRVLPSASLVPENDPSVLFTTAGMQPLAPYLLGAAHPLGKRLVNVQKCVRMQDIEEVGDNTHDTFFEMLGNWSLGDYFKKEQIGWFYDFLTSNEEGLGLDPNRFYITVFAGNKDAPRDDESKEIWMSLGIPEKKIYFLESNWWSPGENGPCGPDSEVFYDVTPDGIGDMSREEYLVADKEQRVVEIGNSVFMEYEKKDGKVIGKLSQKNVDFGGGLERLAMAVQGKTNIFETDLFVDLMEEINKFSGVDDTKAKRILADHIRTVVFIISDGVKPSKTDRGYVARRLIRRAARNAQKLKTVVDARLVNIIIEKYSPIYGNLSQKSEEITQTILEERDNWDKALASAREFIIPQLERFKNGAPIPKSKALDARELFQWSSTLGISLEELLELIDETHSRQGYSKISKERKEKIIKEFQEEFKKHQELSRAGAEKKFKGGLADTSEVSVKYHTATHLLHQALRAVLGEHVFQKGSNITPERMRFDFSHPRKMTPEEVRKVEDLVNEKIKEALPVSYEDIPSSEAEKRGAIGLFGEKYGETVRVYQIGEGNKKFSLEFCGGPHVKNTSELGNFKILKEEAVAAGVRRIKAILEF